MRFDDELTSALLRFDDALMRLVLIAPDVAVTVEFRLLETLINEVLRLPDELTKA